MRMNPLLTTLLDEIHTLHTTVPEVAEFVAFPDDLQPLDLSPRHLPCADHFRAEVCFQNAEHPLAQVLYQAGSVAHWGDSYAGSGASADFMQRFSCYCLIGSGGIWTSATMAAYMVAMPADFYYPWHQHPAEELYYVLAGEGVFKRQEQVGEVSVNLNVGDSAFHASNQPHALETQAQPVMAYVVWRNHLGIKPVMIGS